MQHLSWIIHSPNAVSMVKFSKQLEWQLVPEWRSVYCNYWQLKKDLKQIKLLGRKQTIDTSSLLDSPQRFAGLSRRRLTSRNQNVILVHQRLLPDEEELYETELLEPILSVEQDITFFARLDSQLNKVNNFYRKKETEYCTRAEALNRQMMMLLDTKQLMGSSGLMTDDTEHISETGVTDLLAEAPIEDTNVNRSETNATGTALANFAQSLLNQSKKPVSHESDFYVRNKKVQCAEKMLRMAYVEFYRGLGLLKSYSSLNVVAFAKILKKYDKVTGRKASITYLDAVEKSYFHSSDKAVRLMDKVEKLFTEHFSKNNRKQAMACLRPLQQKASHTVTFFIGLFTGCFAALLAAFSIVSYLRGGYLKATGESTRDYIEEIFPTFSALALLLVHMYMYGWNVYAWRRGRINYAFIFEFAPGTELRHRDILLLSTGLTTVVVGGMVVHLVAHVNAPSSTTVDLIPAAVVLVFLLMLFFPFKIFYHSSRFFFLRCMHHIICSPFSKVVLADFFLADQLTSQVALFRNLEFVFCYYVLGHFKGRNVHSCTKSGISQDAMYLVSLIPYWWRLMQCFRRWIDEGDKMHIANGGKYLSAMIAVATRLTYVKYETTGWLGIFVITSTTATIYQIYWDLVIDWGLLQPYSKNPWLRDQLVLRHKFFYIISMVINALLRFAWLQSITNLQFRRLNHHVTDFIFASLEVFRRGQWNFYRLENEHLNNVGNFRAVKCVPLPFRDVQDIEV